jgi:hypothetical protein
MEPFSEIPPRPKSHTRYHRIAAEIEAIVARLVAHLRADINDTLARRIKLRGLQK